MRDDRPASWANAARMMNAARAHDRFRRPGDGQCRGGEYETDENEFRFAHFRFLFVASETE